MTAARVVSLRELVNPTERQLDFLEAVKTHKYTLYGGAGGGGKAQPLSAVVMTPFGPSTMGQMRVGSLVSNPDGTVAKVIQVHPQGEQDIYEVVFSDGATTRVTGEHLWLVKLAGRKLKAHRQHEDGTAVAGRIADTKWLMGYLERQKRAKRPSWPLIPLAEPVKFTAAPGRWGPPVSVDPYVLGALLGDGCLRQGIIMLTTDDPEILAEIERRTETRIVQSAPQQYHLRESGALRDALTKLGVYGHLSYTKFIPEVYKRASIAVRQELLQGLMDTDGTADERGHCSFYSVSRQLALDVQWLVRSLGGRATITEKAGRYRNDEGALVECATCHCVYIQTKRNSDLFRLPRKKERCRDEFNGGVSELQRRMVDIRHVGREPAQCITVDHPNGLYITDDFIVTHNSYILRWALVALLLKWAKEGHYGVAVGLFCIDYPSLNDRHLKKIRAEFPDWLGKFRESDREFHLAPRFGGGVIAFRNLDNPAKYKSVEFAAIAVDELTENLRQVFEDLRWRLRWLGIDFTPFLAATNPIDIGLYWVKKLWVDRDFTDEPEALDPEDFAYVPAKASDNPHLSPEYLKTLASLKDGMREALLDGSWDVFAGQAFTEWRREVHVCKPFKIPHWWRRWRANDRGYGEPAVWLWFAASPDGQVYVYREYVCIQVRPSEQAANVVAQSIVGSEIPGAEPTIDPETKEPLVEKHSFTSAPDDVNTADAEMGKSWADLYYSGGLTDLVVVRRDPDVRATLVHEYLAPMPHPFEEGRFTAKLQVFETCNYLIRTVPTLPSDPHHPNRVKSGGEDHGFDCLGHGLQAWHPEASKPPAPPKTRMQADKEKLIRLHKQRLRG